jgi:N-acetylmuramoyl-L-alanine amidase
LDAVDASNRQIMVPVRRLTNALGAQTHWDANTRTITITGGHTTISMGIGSAALTVNGRTQTMDQAPVIRDGRTYLPASYVAEVLDHIVSWQASTQTVIIS